MNDREFFVKQAAMQLGALGMDKKQRKPYIIMAYEKYRRAQGSPADAIKAAVSQAKKDKKKWQKV